MGTWGGHGNSLWFPFWLSLLVLFSFVQIAISVSTGIIRAPSPYRLVNAGSCDYKKKKKKKRLVWKMNMERGLSSWLQTVEQIISYSSS